MKMLAATLLGLLVTTTLGCNSAKQRELAAEQEQIYHLRHVAENARLEAQNVSLDEELARRQGKHFDHQLVQSAVQRAAAAEYNLRMEEGLHPELTQ